VTVATSAFYKRKILARSATGNLVKA